MLLDQCQVHKATLQQDPIGYSILRTQGQHAVSAHKLPLKASLTSPVHNSWFPLTFPKGTVAGRTTSHGHQVRWAPFVTFYCRHRADLTTLNYCCTTTHSATSNRLPCWVQQGQLGQPTPPASAFKKAPALIRPQAQIGSFVFVGSVSTT